VVKLLFEKGAELDPKDNDSQTPLGWAAEKGHEAVVNRDRGNAISSLKSRSSQTTGDRSMTKAVPSADAKATPIRDIAGPFI
jgi:ankyrin repeat protein